MAVAPPAIGARPDREPQVLAAGGVPAPSLPIVRLWSFAIQETAPGDRLATSPFLNGPAIIESLYLVQTDDSNAPNPTITVWYAPSLPPSGNATVNLADLGTPLFTDSVITSEVGAQFQGPVQHIPAYTFAGTNHQIVIPLRFYISLDRFQLGIRLGTQVAAKAIAGHFRILERVPPNLVPNFL